MNASSPGSALYALLIEAVQAYRQGLRRQPHLRPAMPARDFNALMFLGTLGWVPLESRRELRELNLACNKGLMAARQGLLQEAVHHYERAEDHLAVLAGKAHLAWLLGVSTFQAGVAYVDFRRGCAHRARERLDCAMDADLELEQAGLPVMQMHRIQQGHNLARMDFRLGRRKSAIQLSGELLAYLEGQTDELPYHNDWCPRGLQAVPRSLLQEMIHQIVGETAGHVVTSHEPAEEWRLLIQACSLCREPEAAVFPQVQLGLMAQKDLLANQPADYLRSLIRFFGAGIRRCRSLWYPVLIELVGFCDEMDTDDSRFVRDLILRDSAKWKGFPPYLRNRLDGLAAQRNVA